MKKSSHSLDYQSPPDDPLPTAQFDFDRGWQRLAEPAGKRGRSASLAIRFAGIVGLLIIAYMMAHALMKWFTRP
jgi:hypothetical protein